MLLWFSQITFPYGYFCFPYKEIGTSPSIMERIGTIQLLTEVLEKKDTRFISIFFSVIKNFFWTMMSQSLIHYNVWKRCFSRKYWKKNCLKALFSIPCFLASPVYLITDRNYTTVTGITVTEGINISFNLLQSHVLVRFSQLLNENSFNCYPMLCLLSLFYFHPFFRKFHSDRIYLLRNFLCFFVQDFFFVNNMRKWMLGLESLLWRFHRLSGKKVILDNWKYGLILLISSKQLMVNSSLWRS